MNHHHVASTMIASSDVNGTDVYSYDGNRIGEIDHLMIDKLSGRISYAVMSFGGFLSMGQDYHPIPWGALKYDTEKGGYVTNITREKLESAPDRNDSWQADRTWEQRTHEHYGVAPYWPI